MFKTVSNRFLQRKLVTNSFKTRSLLSSSTKRYLNLHEYQSKELMNEYNVRVQKGYVSSSVSEARKIGQNLLDNGAKELVIKAQIHAGGRGKGHFIPNQYQGGVKIIDNINDIDDIATNMLGNHLVTKQTGPEGQLCNKLLVHEGIFFDKEYYFAILMDRAHNGPVIVVSKQGGMDIEEVAESNPKAIVTRAIDIKQGITTDDLNVICKALDFNNDEQIKQDACQQIQNLYNLFIGTDATQVEINPLVQTIDNKIYCVDAKINFDESAEFRQLKLFQLRDTSMEDIRDVQARKYQLNYIGLDGTIGCMVNGAGLAMATMDIIELHGGSPANFLDVGGNANEKQVEEAFKIITSDSNCQAILVNIFGGIMKCDVIAQGIVNAATNLKLQVPLIVRLEGTNVEKGNEILDKSGLNFISANDLDDAAIKAVQGKK